MQKILKSKASNYVLILISLILSILTIIFGKMFFDYNYFFIASLLIIIYAIIPFVFIYEKRRPRAREIMVVASMTTIAVVSRIVFFIPQFKPMSAVVIISGATLGPETGFIVGLLSAFISNFFYGQGPYTLYQMIALGIIGAVSGFIFSSRKINKTVISVFGFIAVFVVYGGIVNFGTLFMAASEINAGSIIAIFATGLQFDLIHAASTAIFLFLLAKPFEDKLSRLKTKYGVLNKDPDYINNDIN